MKITDLLCVGAVDLNVTASSKEEVLKKAVELMVRQGNITDKEQYLKAVFARVPEKLWEPVEFLVGGWYQRFLFPMPGMAELVQELKENGYHLYLLSNASAALRDYFPRIPGSECFEKLMVSAEEKLLKPSFEIYRRLYEKFGLNPKECWFIDDSPANVEGAICTGMGGTIFYGDIPRLRRELRRVGIRCRE